MSEQKTKPTAASVQEFLEAVPDEKKRADAFAVCKLMTEVTGQEPVLWGPSIVGFGRYHYVYASGHSGDAPLTGFSPRKTALTLYIMGGFDNYDELMAKLGKYTMGKACLYLKRLSDVDQKVLRDLIAGSYRHMQSLYPPTS
jgi:hypothetical protein